MTVEHLASTPIAASNGYLFSESAHRQLRSVQETVHLLYLLTLSGSEEPPVPPERWTSCLHLIHTLLDEAVDSAEWRPSA